MGVPQQSPSDVQDHDLQPGQMVSGKGIFIGTFDLFDARGRSLGFRTRWYDTAVELGEPKTFNDTANAVANCNVNGRGGLRLDPARYETELFEELKTDEALGKNVIAPLEVVKAISSLRNKGEYKLRSNGDMSGRLITLSHRMGGAHWQLSCTPDRHYPSYVRAVDFRDGHVGWVRRGTGRLSGRPCFAELAL